MIAPPILDDRTAVVASSRIPPMASSSPESWPGRWLGGLIGSLACLPPIAIGLAFNDGVFAKPAGFRDLFGAVATVAALGIPIGWILGRQLWPALRSGGWRRAVAVGLAFGWIAPPLGAIEITWGGLLVPWAQPPILLGTDGWWILPFALPVSFLAAPLTLAVGLAWAVAARAVPDAWLAGLRVREPLERLGTRHALIAFLSWMVLAEAATVALTGGRARPW
jgi:hypothetical protein